MFYVSMLMMITNAKYEEHPFGRALRREGRGTHSLRGRKIQRIITTKK